MTHRSWKHAAVIAAGVLGLAAVPASNGRAAVSAGDRGAGPSEARQREGGQAGPSGKRTTADGVFTADQARRGREQYRKRCVLCHLDNGQGREAAPFIPGQSLEREGDTEAPSVAGEAFLKKWNGHTAKELFEKLTSTMPVGGAGTLTPQEYADVLAYLFELSKLPAGQQELPAARDQLDLITIGR